MRTVRDCLRGHGDDRCAEMHASTTWRQRIDRRIDQKMVVLSHADEIWRELCSAP